MKIAIIGAGHIGGNVARRFAAAGHDITVSFSRNEAALNALAGEIGGHADRLAGAVTNAEIVVVSVPWGAIPEALSKAGSLEGRIVIDTTNQFGAGPKPTNGQTAAAFNASRMAGARYTKSFNTLTAAFQARAAERPVQRRVVQWLCGDDVDAKVTVSRLIEQAGFVAVDLGAVSECTVMEAPRRAGSVYGEEYRLPEALAVADAVRAGREIPPTPHYPPSAA